MLAHRAVFLPHRDDALVFALIESRLQRVQQAHLVVAAVRHGHAVDEQSVIGGVKVTRHFHDLGYVHKLALTGHQAGIAALDEDVELRAQVTTLGDENLGQQGKTGAVG